MEYTILAFIALIFYGMTFSLCVMILDQYKKAKIAKRLSNTHNSVKINASKQTRVLKPLLITASKTLLSLPIPLNEHINFVPLEYRQVKHSYNDSEINFIDGQIAFVFDSKNVSHTWENVFESWEKSYREKYNLYHTGYGKNIEFRYDDNHIQSATITVNNGIKASININDATNDIKDFGKVLKTLLDEDTKISNEAIKFPKYTDWIFEDKTIPAWIENHKIKYPYGKLPEQDIEILCDKKPIIKLNGNFKPGMIKNAIKTVRSTHNETFVKIGKSKMLESSK